jgi:hypothetical protein
MPQECAVHDRITFLGSPDEVLDPAAALDDVIETVDHLKPEAITLSEQVEDGAVSLELEADFGADGQEKAKALKAALIRAEGEAGFRQQFGASAARSERWAIAELNFTDLALPNGELFGLPTPIVGVESEVAQALRLTGSGFGQTLYAKRRPADSALARSFVRPLAQTEGATAATARVASALRTTMELAAREGWSVREGVSLSTSANQASAEIIEATLLRRASALYPFLPAAVQRVNWNVLGDELKVFGGASVQERIAPLRPSTYVGQAMRSILASAVEQSRRSVSVARRAPSAGPRIDGDFAFFSYAHADGPRALAVMSELTRRGVRTWYDAHLGASQAWDEYLEQRVRSCAGIIACVSNAYEASRYCRRELKFADLLDKPIVPVSVDPKYAWGPGLEMRFQEYQILNAADANWPEAAVNLLKAKASRCLGAAT